MSKKLSINKKLEKLEEKKEELLKEQEEESKVEEVKKSKKKELIFEGKKESDFILKSPCNVMGMGKIQNFEDDDKPLHLVIDFDRKNEDLKILSDLRVSETFEVWKGKVKWGKYCMEYYRTALKVVEGWADGDLNFYVAKKKDMPLLMAYGDLGFVLAPRVDREDEE